MVFLKVECETDLISVAPMFCLWESWRSQPFFIQCIYVYY